jgi:Holliday junction resolvasome RuvABC endonuclease subunit
MPDPMTAPFVNVVAIDPGLDRVAIAVFVVPTANRRGLSAKDYWSKALPDEKARTFAYAQSHDTPAADDIVKRLWDISLWLDLEINQLRPKLILVEMPAYAAVYARHAKNGARSSAATAPLQNKLYMSIGAILTTAVDSHSGIVRAVPAQSTNKKQRLQLVEMLLKAAGKDRPKNEDQRDAVSIGLAAQWDL